MEKVRPWCSQPPDRGWLKNRTEVLNEFWAHVLNAVVNTGVREELELRSVHVLRAL